MARWQVHEDKVQPQKKGTSYTSRTLIQFRRKKQSQHHKRYFFINGRSVHFYISSTVKLNKLSFPHIEINNPFPTSIHSSLLYVTSKFNQTKETPITFRIESHIISINNNTDNLRKFTNVNQKREGSIMETLGTPVLIGHSCKNVQFRSHTKSFLTQK